MTRGTVLTDSLRLVRPLAAGGMASIWIAEHFGLSTQVVVKFIAAGLADNPAVVARFRREAAAASQMRSPHVVQMIDYGVTRGGVPFIAMELLEGHDLGRQLRAQGVMPPREVATIVSQTAKALARAHERGVIHRDVKPANIFLADVGAGEAFVKVLDFGIAKAIGHDSMDATTAGVMIGTPYYMSPEQILGLKTIGHQADLWSLGVVSFEALTGRLPFTGETIPSVSMKICHGAIPRPSDVNPRLPPFVDTWFARACSRDPEQRFRNALEMADALEQAVGGAAKVRLVDDDDARTEVRLPENADAPVPSEKTHAMSPASFRVGTGTVVAPSQETNAGLVAKSAGGHRKRLLGDRSRRTEAIVVAGFLLAAVAAASGIVFGMRGGPPVVGDAPLPSSSSPPREFVEVKAVGQPASQEQPAIPPASVAMPTMSTAIAKVPPPTPSPSKTLIVDAGSVLAVPSAGAPPATPTIVEVPDPISDPGF
jgi:serine/threonine protein kinase